MWFQGDWKDWVVGRKSTCGNPLDFHCHKFLICIRPVRKLAHKVCYLLTATSERTKTKQRSREKSIVFRPTVDLKNPRKLTLRKSMCMIAYSWFSLTWWDGHCCVRNNGKMHNNIVKFPKDLSLLFCTWTWPPWRHVKTESKFQDNTVNDNEHDDDNINFFFYLILCSQRPQWGIDRSADNKRQQLNPNAHTS